MVKEGEKLVTNAIYDHFLEQDSAQTQLEGGYKRFNVRISALKPIFS
jgi:hypothetical protein